ncbi:hypothetical protein QR680_009845 [Steinernema hermaphroditum]|uniref:Eukaryotic translation initiation factor 4C n=1 Tax=Steinernema hermaphroditum TaxID=289476 RepID=A0AA39ILU8_9BILA|nr:hypothetical protein QR680_009845 [Steinernema hermaphroditum]
MPKNKGKGGKNRRRGKNENDVLKREIIFKEEGQAYAQVIKMLGNGRLTAFCFDGKSRLCHIRGKLRKKVWINTGDIILADVILKYNPDEARVLKTKGELPENAKLNEGGDDQDEGGVEFADMGLDFEDEKNDQIELPSDDSEEESEEEEEEEEEESEEEESSEEESDVDEEQLARGNFKKPGARDRYGKANKGKPRK